MTYSLNESGMIVVTFGLIGVFMVLLLFFATIIFMQKIIGLIENKSKDKANPTG
jgi:predicted RND superfamily exporter protein